MKKTYTKPLIVYESFKLSTNIAASCTFLGTQSAQYTCPVYDPQFGFNIFAETTVDCDMTPPGGNDSICYDIPIANSNVFSS